MDEKKDITSKLYDFIDSLSSDQVSRAIKFVDDNASTDSFFIRIRELAIERKNEYINNNADYF